MATFTNSPASPPDVLPFATTRPARKRRTTEVVPAAPNSTISGPYLTLKALLEPLLALAMLLAAGPVILLLALVIRLTSRGPAFYTQVRVGLGGRRFTIYKLRTMVHECESLTGPRWAIRGDPRITPLGHFLRVSHLDELPQLLNVLRGDMSLIGPRPERPEFVGQLERAVPGYRQRMAVRPGVTGLAQVQLAADTDIASVRRKLLYDVHYINHFSLVMDVRILVATVVYALGNPLQLTRHLVPSGEVVEAPNGRLWQAGAIEQPLAA